MLAGLLQCAKFAKYRAVPGSILNRRVRRYGLEAPYCGFARIERFKNARDAHQLKNDFALGRGGG